MRYFQLGELALSDIDNLISMINAKKDLNAISDEAKRLGDQADAAGFKKAGGLLDAIYIEAGEAANDWENPDYYKWQLQANNAKKDLAALAALSPAQSAANSAPIERRQNQLEQQISALKKSIGDTLSAKGAFIGTDTSPIQNEWASISNEIRNATLLSSDRERLLNRQKILLGKTGEAVAKAGKEGKDITKELAKLGCMLDANPIKCFIKNNKAITAAVVIGILVVIGFMIYPYIAMFSLVRK